MAWSISTRGILLGPKVSNMFDQATSFRGGFFRVLSPVGLKEINFDQRINQSPVFWQELVLLWTDQGIGCWVYIFLDCIVVELGRSMEPFQRMDLTAGQWVGYVPRPEGRRPENRGRGVPPDFGKSVSAKGGRGLHAWVRETSLGPSSLQAVWIY